MGATVDPVTYDRSQTHDPARFRTLMSMDPLARLRLNLSREESVDAALAVLSVLLGVFPYLVLAAKFDWRLTPDSLLWAAATCLVAFGSIAVRSTHPMVFLGVVAGSLIVQWLLVPSPTIAVVLVPFASYTVARLVSGRASRWVLGLGAVGAVIAPARWLLSRYGASATLTLVSVLLSVVSFAVVLVSYVLGRRARDAAAARDQALAAETQRYEAMLRDQEHQVQVAQAQTRNQIARELHDIVAHSLSVMVVQAEGGKAVALTRPEAASEALGVIAETGRQALDEMRQIVAVLRDPEQEGATEYRPSPGLADVPAMVEKAGASLATSGAVPTVPVGVGLTVYRVVQEALTNVMKHAGTDAHPTVTLRYLPDTIAIEVADTGVGPAPDARAGHGLTGMAERVAAHGGVLNTRSGPDGGYVVQAQVPLGAIA